MAKVTYTLLDRDYDSIPENENYSQSDINLIENYQVNKSFRADRHYIETHFYSLNNSKIFSLYNYDISTDVDIDAEGNVTNLNLKPEQLSIDNGFTGVDHKIVYHFLNDLYSQTDSKQPLFINTISQDRKEVLLYTDDIDVNTLRSLEEALDNFAGCAVVISHDRWFLDRICTHILAFEGDSQVYFFEGGFSDYEENKKKRLGDSGPKRIKYKKLVR